MTAWTRPRRERDEAGGIGVLGVIGARGGAGASVTGALLARAFARRGPTALVDLGPPPALAVLLGAEATAGLRWPDLAGARGHVDPGHLARALPRWARCTLLSGDPARPGPPTAEVEGDVLTALATAHPTVVLDLGRLVPGCSRGGGPTSVRGRDGDVGTGAGTVPDLGCGAAGRCDLMLLVVPRDLPAVVAAQELYPTLVGVGCPVGLVVRGPAPGGLGSAEVARAVGLPLLGALPGSRSVAAALDRGLGPRVGRRGVRAVDRLAGRIVGWAA